MKTLREIAESVDKANAEYILNDNEIATKYWWIQKCIKTGKLEYAKSGMESLMELIRRYNETHLTPKNAQVGDGATINLFSDRHACTIIRVTKSTVTVRRDKATLNPDFKPEFIPGGFVAHCTNQSKQTYSYESDENGQVYTFHWSKKFQRYGQPGSQTLSRGRHEFYDYNF